MNPSMNESQVRQIAYKIWEAEGCPSGQAERHWNMALSQAEAEDDEYAAGQEFSDDGLGFGSDSARSGASSRSTFSGGRRSGEGELTNESQISGETDLSGQYEFSSGRSGTRGSSDGHYSSSRSSSYSETPQQIPGANAENLSDENARENSGNENSGKKKSRFFS